MTQPIASLSVDLDDKWAYLRTHGDASWRDYPSYLDKVVPRIAAWAAERNLRITFFVVGRDAEQPRSADPLAALAAAGHEIGNHSLNHYPWMYTLSRDEVAAEIAEAEAHIERATGQRPVGFRSPAYSLSNDTLEILAQRGYEYDATTLPTFIGPLARWYFRQSASPEAAEEAERRELFGTVCDGLRPIRPYVVETAAGPLVEVPVTTFPIIRMPIHMTYLVYLWQFSPALAHSYFWLALAACRLRRIGPSMLLHPLDFLDIEDAPDLRFLPGMMVPREEKLLLINEVLGRIQSHYRVVPIREQAREVRREAGVAVATPAEQVTAEPLATVG
jgi:hypothetical protein